MRRWEDDFDLLRYHKEIAKPLAVGEGGRGQGDRKECNGKTLSWKLRCVQADRDAAHGKEPGLLTNDLSPERSTLDS